MENRARTTLDARRLELTALAAAAARPHRGWVRAIRDALGMSATDLASRIDVTQSTVTRMEASERAGTIQLDTLRRLADALDCELTYALVPRQPLEDAVRRQAAKRAATLLAGVQHTMALEAQALSSADLEAQIAIVADGFVDSPGLWRDDQ